MRPCIQQDPYNRFYEDFFQVVTRANRLEDWVSLLVTLKKCINQYPKHGCRDAELKPTCRNSLAFEGNFLEAINLTMNCKFVDPSQFGTKHVVLHSPKRTGVLAFHFTVPTKQIICKHVKIIRREIC